MLASNCYFIGNLNWRGGDFEYAIEGELCLNSFSLLEFQQSSFMNTIH